MTTQLQRLTKGLSTAAPSPGYVPSGFVQRKCACGGTPGPTGECEACRRKRLSQAAANKNAHAPVARIGHDFSRVPVHSGEKNTPSPVAAPVAAPAAAPPDKELASSLFAGNADLKEVLNRRKLLRSGSTGDAVRLVQEALLAEGYELPKFGADGIFGPETAKAVREFQQRWRLQVDSIVGDQTLGLLDLHLVAKSVLAIGEALPGALGGVVRGIAAGALDKAEEEHRKTACPAADQAERLTGCIEIILIANDDGSSPTAPTSMALAQRIWEKCCINYSVLSTKTINKTDFKTLDESPTNVPTAEETALFAAAGSSNCIQVFIPADFAQGGRVGKDISGGGATYDAGTAHPKVVVVEGTVPAVVAHEIGHASGHLAHDGNPTVMKPTGAHNVANSSRVSTAVCTAARTGSVLKTTSGKADCCMFPK